VELAQQLRGYLSFETVQVVWRTIERQLHPFRCLASAKLLPDGDDTKAFAFVKYELDEDKRETAVYSMVLW
jgi:hypothetical protein